MHNPRTYTGLMSSVKLVPQLTEMAVAEIAE